MSDTAPCEKVSHTYHVSQYGNRFCTNINILKPGVQTVWRVDWWIRSSIVYRTPEFVTLPVPLGWWFCFIIFCFQVINHILTQVHALKVWNEWFAWPLCGTVGMLQIINFSLSLAIFFIFHFLFRHCKWQWDTYVTLVF